MALRFYHDAAGTQEITEANPDFVRKAVPAGQTLSDVKQIFLKTDNPEHEYENVAVTGVGAPSGVQVEYATSSSGPWSTTLTRPNGAYATASPLWRRFTVPNVQDPDKIETIKHRVQFDAYVGEE